MKKQHSNRRTSLSTLKTTPSQATDDAYLAGLVDGEGSIVVYGSRSHRSFQLRLAIMMTSKETIGWIADTYGGTTSIGRKTVTGRTEYLWYVYSDAVVEILRRVFPYLKTKKRQAALAFKFREVMKQGLYSKDEHRLSLMCELVETIHSLNRGVAGVETERVAPIETNGMMFQSELQGDLKRDVSNDLS